MKQILLLAVAGFLALPLPAADRPNIVIIAGTKDLNAAPAVDASTIRGKVMCGYQGWFRCPGDAAGMGWIHYSRSRSITAESLTFEMWPDVRELGKDERFAAPEF